jgi:hypothetical protein
MLRQNNRSELREFADTPPRSPPRMHLKLHYSSQINIVTLSHHFVNRGLAGFGHLCFLLALLAGAIIFFASPYL